MLKGTLHSLPDGTLISSEAPGKTTTHGFLISVEVEPGYSTTPILAKLQDALTWVDGVGEVDVEHLGMIDILDAEETTPETPHES